MEKEQKSHKLLIILLIILVALLGVGGSLGIWYWQQGEMKKQRSDSDKRVQELQKQINELKSAQEPKKEEKKSNKGFIEGTLTYPSEGIPTDLTVYAENIDTGAIYQTSDRINDARFTTHIGYKIEVPEGNYYVYATVARNPTQKAYYNKYITCGMSVDCHDTTKIKVTVTADETTDNITVGDWWNP